jgi:hypothetical protein
MSVARTGLCLRTPAPLLAAALAISLMASLEPGSRAEEATVVQVERVRPKKEKLPTLRFLKENRDFIRAQYDLLRQKRGGDLGDAGEIDPRFLAYQKMLREALAARDTVAAADDSLKRQALLASIGDLARLEERLDTMDRLLAGQRSRLRVLQEDFTGRQQTALIVVLKGYPSRTPVATISITLEDGDTLTVPLTPEHRAALERGGIVQIFHGFVEPREQVVEIAIRGERWPAGDKGFVRLAPARDRVTLLRLDLTSVQPDRGATSIEATTWLHDTRLPLGDG